MTEKLRKDILAFLTPLNQFRTPESRQALLFGAGLDTTILSIDLGGSAMDFVALLVQSIEQYGILFDGTPALIRLLQELQTQLGVNKQQELQIFCNRYEQEQGEIELENIGETSYSLLSSIFQPDVFICYAREDMNIAKRLYHDLKRVGVSTWMDTEDLKPGEEWKSIIPEIIEKSSYILILLSSHSVLKRGYVQHEIKHALKISEEAPPSTIFIIPVRLDKCEPPAELGDLHWADLFPDYTVGFDKLLRVLAPEGQVEFLHRRIEELTETLKQLEQKKKKATDHTTITRLENKITEVNAQRQQIGTQAIHLQQIIIPTKEAHNPIQEAQRVFELNHNWQPLNYKQNEYEDLGDTIVDHNTELTWQKSGSEISLRYEEAQKYIEELNHQNFAGYHDWRLPTIPELMSLLEPEKQSNGMNISPIFDNKQRYCWSINRLPKGKYWRNSIWNIYFSHGTVYWDSPLGDYYVRCVRP